MQLDGETLEQTQLYMANQESALCLSLDVISKQQSVYLSIGTNSKVVVLKRDADSTGNFVQTGLVKKTSDNVSCVKVVAMPVKELQDSDIMLMYATYNGRVSWSHM
jgi:hypothetical protein